MECCFCGKSIEDGCPTVALTYKGCKSINDVSEARLDERRVYVEVGQRVHTRCRLDFIRPRKDGASGITNRDEERSVSRRSATSPFIWKEHCFFCGQAAKYDGRKRGNDVFPVRTGDFQECINSLCNSRNDDWADAVRGRIECVNDLHAADAIYHQACNVNFRTRKQIPRKHQDADSASKRQKGRPKESDKLSAFMKIVHFLEDNDEEQISISDLTTKMGEYLEESGDSPYSAKYMKTKLQEHFGDRIVITSATGRSHIGLVTFHKTAQSIINDFYKRPFQNDYELEKNRIVETAAKLIKTEIKALDTANSDYPSSEEMSNIDKALAFIPNLLRLFLSGVFVGKDTSVKVASIGHAIVQATRPKAIIAPLQLGLGIQMHHNFASKFLIDSLNAHGFCSPYSIVQKYERSAAVSHGTELPVFSSENFVQHIADNVDHNIRTLDGSGTFHGMGIIATITPGRMCKKTVPRKSVTSEEILAMGQINICSYQRPAGDNAQLFYKELKNLQAQDVTANLDLLWKVTLPHVHSPRPGWSGIMQSVCHGEHPGKSTVMFLPMIDLDPSDMTCIYSTLSFVTQQAERYNITPILTFDQPLWWKALTIILNEPQGSNLKSVVLRLGGFHIQMSFLGSIGHLMAGSGLQDILELVYAKNAVIHMLSGKAVSRAIRGHFLVDGALNAMLVSKAFNVPLPDGSQGPQAQTSSTNEDRLNNVPCASNSTPLTDTDIQEPDVECEHVTRTAQELINDERQSEDTDLRLAESMFKRLQEGKSSVVETCSADVFNRISDRLTQARDAMNTRRTAALWFTYMRMIDVLRKFIKAERTGNWDLHLQSVYDMLPYFAAAGHHLYAKSAHIYLQMMSDLQDNHPEVYRRFQGGFHCARRSDRYWAGLSTDLVIEQVLMRSVKTSGGLTRGRGMTEVQRLVWLMSMPACAEVNDAMQTITCTRYETSEQHKETTTTRKVLDTKETLDIIEYLSQKDPFSEEQSLRCIATGVEADSEVNVDKCKEVGDKVLRSMVGKGAFEYSFRKKDQAVTLASKTAVRFKDGRVQVDPQLLFQRLSFVATGGQYEHPESFFKFEMCSYPPALFNSSLLPRQANKPVLADAIWARTKDVQTAAPTGNVHYVLDGGALLHRVPWPRGLTYNDIFLLYVQYVSRRYKKATVVFDGYEEGPSTKDCAHLRRTGSPSPRVNFDCDMAFRLKKEDFLRNEENKQRFINLLGEKLQSSGYSVLYATADADLMIAQAGIRSAKEETTVVVGDDTDLLVLLSHHYTDEIAHDLFFIPEPKQRSTTSKIWNIRDTTTALGHEVCASLHFVHAILGCDTTSAVHGIGKGQALKKILNDSVFQEQARVFNRPDVTKNDVIVAGEKALVCLYKGQTDESLDRLRYSKFCQKVTTGNAFVQPECLPPTSAAAVYHSLRVYQQVQQWKGIALPPTDWGWTLQDGKLLPLLTDLPAAHESLLEIIRCNCKTDCNSQRCSCKKHDLECSAACGTCRGQSCSNCTAPDLSENDE